jgi:hypothetical protein
MLYNYFYAFKYNKPNSLLKLISLDKFNSLIFFIAILLIKIFVLKFHIYAFIKIDRFKINI